MVMPIHNLSVFAVVSLCTLGRFWTETGTGRSTFSFNVSGDEKERGGEAMIKHTGGKGRECGRCGGAWHDWPRGVLFIFMCRAIAAVSAGTPGLSCTRESKRLSELDVYVCTKR